MFYGDIHLLDILLFAARPDLGRICISYSFANATERPVGTKQELLGDSLIGSFIKAIKSIPDAPSVL